MMRRARRGPKGGGGEVLLVVERVLEVLVLVVGITRAVDLVRMLVLVVEVLVVGGTRPPVDRVLMLVLGLVLVVVARTVDLVVVRMLVEVLEDLMLVVDVVVLTDEVELSDGTAGPVRYQFSAGSPRHSPTVTALYPLENSEVKM